ncbi:7885_t:CDS:2 [Acaulospora morrowiae]|uniref:7885_t:CDS:1 n=1 Tax=Acaulospora morrowiae TaxID=94023 RepID=A0A9N9A4G6_9GLOM|nr:7885_t:CDS:2 [Acaulospora morrowiae]
MAEQLVKGIGDILKENNELKKNIEETEERYKQYENLYKEETEISEALRKEAKVEDETLSKEFDKNIGKDTIENLQRKANLEMKELNYWQEKALVPKYEYYENERINVPEGDP